MNAVDEFIQFDKWNNWTGNKKTAGIHWFRGKKKTAGINWLGGAAHALGAGAQYRPGPPPSVGAQLGVNALNLGVGLLGMTIANEAYAAAKSAFTRSRDFKRMMTDNPDLMDRDPKVLHSLFNTIHQTAPTLAANPLIAGSMIRKYEISPNYIDPKLISDLAMAEANVRKTQTLMTPEQVGKTTQSIRY